MRDPIRQYAAINLGVALGLAALAMAAGWDWPTIYAGVLTGAVASDVVFGRRGDRRV